VTAGDEPVSAAISARRSVRKFARLAVDGATVERLVALACTAPAPHHSRPWRFVNVASPSRRERLADAMADAWRADLESAGESVHTIDRLLTRSRSQVTEAPVLLLACLVLDEARDWSDEPRRLAERDMFVQSLGAALQNILLAAADFGLAGYLKGAPLFCSDAVHAALELPPDWHPTFLVLLGYPDKSNEPAPRGPVDLDEHFALR
jgi:coenzyme F420-0:L-glutamate ligase / coenzyme F420-1:gamma-L-glutamate ligase